MKGPNPALAIAARTDAKILAAARHCDAGTNWAEMGRAADVGPHATRRSVARLKARGEWPYPFPLSGIRRVVGSSANPLSHTGDYVTRGVKFTQPETPISRCYALQPDHWNRAKDAPGESPGDAARRELSLWRASRGRAS